MSRPHLMPILALALVSCAPPASDDGAPTDLGLVPQPSPQGERDGDDRPTVGDSTDDVIGVVIETNLRIGDSEPWCHKANAFELVAVPSCGGPELTILICTDQDVCDEALANVVAAVTDCQETGLQVVIDMSLCKASP